VSRQSSCSRAATDAYATGRATAAIRGDGARYSEQVVWPAAAGRTVLAVALLKRAGHADEDLATIRIELGEPPAVNGVAKNLYYDDEHRIANIVEYPVAVDVKGRP
jgi:hypothetical protein